MENSTQDSLRKRSIKKYPKIRRLRTVIAQPKENVPEVRKKSWSTLKFVSIVVPLSIAIFCLFNLPPKMDFISCYRQQYNKIVHGSCGRDIDTTALFKNIAHNNILHQQKAFDKIEMALRNNSRFLSLALVGPPGVGKSLFVNALVDNFPWKKNALRYAWNTLVDNELDKFHMLRYYINRISECGRNLLVIDSLAPCDEEIVNVVHEMFAQSQDQERVQESRKEEKKHLIVIFVFTLNTMLDTETYNKHHQMLQSLPNTTTINFRRFEQADVGDCIKRELSMENLLQTGTDFNQVLSSVNPQISGCKNVRAKVLMYSTGRTAKTDDENNKDEEIKTHASTTGN